MDRSKSQSKPEPGTVTRETPEPTTDSSESSDVDRLLMNLASSEGPMAGEDVEFLRKQDREAALVDDEDSQATPKTSGT